MLTPLKAIRAKCLECCGGSAKEVRLCQSPQCPLWGLRSGHRPRVYKIPKTKKTRFWKKKPRKNQLLLSNKKAPCITADQSPMQETQPKPEGDLVKIVYQVPA